MKVFEAISKGFAVTGKNPGLLVLFFVFSIGWGIISLPFMLNLQNAQLQNNQQMTPQLAAQLGISFIMVLLLVLVYLLLYVFITGGVFGTLKDAIITNGKVELKNFAKYGAKYYLRLLGLNLVLFVLSLLAFGVICILIIGSLVVKNIIVNIVGVSIAIILLIMCMYYLFLLIFSPYALFIGDSGIFKAIKDSFSFTKSNFWKAVGLNLLLIIILIAIWVIPFILLMAISVLLRNITGQVISGVISSATTSYTTILSTAILMTYYYGFTVDVNINAGQS